MRSKIEARIQRSAPRGKNQSRPLAGKRFSDCSFISVSVILSSTMTSSRQCPTESPRPKFGLTKQSTAGKARWRCRGTPAAKSCASGKIVGSGDG